MKRCSDVRHSTRNKRAKANVPMCMRSDLETFREEVPVFPSDASTNDQIALLSFSNEHEETKRTLDEKINAVLPIEYLSWENSIAFHSNLIDVPKTDDAGWIPTRHCRTLAAYRKEVLGRTADFIEHPRFDDRHRAINWCSIFPFHDAVILKNFVDNHNYPLDLNYKPKYVHPEQDLVVTDLPIEPPPVHIRRDKAVVHSSLNSTKNNRESRLHRTRNVLARAGLLGVLPDENEEIYREKPKIKSKSRSTSSWNLSNDFHYDVNADQEFRSKRQMRSSQNVDLIDFPVFRTIDELRDFHRSSLRFSNTLHSWTSIQLETTDTRPSSARSKADLTGRQGDLLLFEYSEQYPILLNETGMFSRICTYLRPQHFQAETCSLEVEYGELIYTHASPFLWSIPRGLNVQTLENNMFIATIYRQMSHAEDFLVVFDPQHGFHIRTLPCLFTVGQQYPLIEVPIPQSKRVNFFQRDLLQIFIYRLFSQSAERPRRIRIEDIKRVFPRLAESSIRKRLKTSADFRRTDDCNSWILRNDSRLPSEDEIRTLIQPELFCAYASMTAAEQRLKDIGYCDKHHLDFDHDDEPNNISSDLHDEILQAPWNTTRAYLGALKGKCLMQIFGIGAKNIHKTKITDELKRFRRTVTGTDADLRRLQLKDARKLLLKFNISEKIIQSLTRWEIVDLVRTLSTQQAKDGMDTGMMKFARGAKHLQARQFEKYKDNCQKQFELQNRLFTSPDEQLTDEETPDEGDENAQLLDEMSRTLEDLLGEHSDRVTISRQRPKMLRIVRTYIDPQGQTYQREEVIRRNDSVIQAYVRIRQNKSDKFIKAYYALDETERETLRRERRRLQEQLRRVKRNELRYNQYEKQQMLFQIQQENLALLQSTCPSTTTTTRPTSFSPNYPHASLALNLSDDDDEESSSSKQ